MNTRVKRNAILLSVFLFGLSAIVAAQTNITGAGATFPGPMYSKWFDEYHKKLTDVQINYQQIGSSGGIKQITDGTVDFGATDGPMTDEQLKTYKEKHGGVEILHYPTVLGAVVLTYNIPGVGDDLQLTPEAVAGIFLGKITKWNDPTIASQNKGMKLPGDDILVAHRSDGSGTTYVFTDYLTKVSKEWETKVGRGPSPSWPVGLGAKNNDGVAGVVKQNQFSIGYVELIYARQNKMSVAKIKNSSGVFIKPSLASVSAAAAGVAMPDDFRVSITNGAGKDAYPISTFTWLLIPAKIQDPAKKKALVEFLKWMIGPGQNFTEALDYAKLPKPVVDKETKAISKVM